MAPSHGENRGDGLDAARTERTLRDVLHELPVDALVPDGWRVGTEVLQFEDRLPTDGVTLRHQEYPRDLVITSAGTEDPGGLAVHERDRVAGRRTVVASAPATGDDRATLEAALEAAGRAAARIETGSGESATVDGADPGASLSTEGGDRRLHFY